MNEDQGPQPVQARTYKLTDADGKVSESQTPGLLGGNRALKIYGRLDCWSARRAIPKGYARNRVFFADEATAIEAGYRPCGHCMRDRYRQWRAGGTPGTSEYPWRVPPPKPSNDSRTDDELALNLFASYGAAMFASELVHRRLRDIYALSFRDPRSACLPRIHEKLLETNRLTMGRVLDLAKEYLPKPIADEAGAAVERRNHLAHHFWWDERGTVGTRQGREELAASLAKTREELNRLGESLRLHYRSILLSRGLSDEVIDQHEAPWDELGPPNPLPSRRLPRKNESITDAWVAPDLMPGVQVVIFRSDDDLYWQLTEVGLGWAYVTAPEPHWPHWEPVQKFLPATVEARPRRDNDWNYVLRFSTGPELSVEVDTSRGAILWEVRTRGA